MRRNVKIRGIEDLAGVARSERERGRTVVQCHGVFDLLHVGHIRHFQEAATFGDTLVVTITPDRFVNKGPHRPAFKEELRAEAIASLECVDYVGINDWPTAVETIDLGGIMPDGFRWHGVVPDGDLVGPHDEQRVLRVGSAPYPRPVSATPS